MKLEQAIDALNRGLPVRKIGSTYIGYIEGFTPINWLRIKWNDGTGRLRPKVCHYGEMEIVPNDTQP